MKLLETLSEINRLNELAEAGFSDLDAIREVLAVRQENLVQCVDRLLGAARYYKGRVEQIEKLRDECQAEITRCKAKREGLKTFAGECMDQLGVTQLAGETGKFARQKNGGKAPVTSAVILGDLRLSNIVGFEDVEKIPQKYLKRVELFTVNMDAVRADLDAGVEVSGFTLAERGTHIRESL